MRKGLCFKCHKPGHWSNNCKEGTPTITNTALKTPPAYSPKIATSSKKMTPREIYTHIQSLTTAMKMRKKNLTNWLKMRVFKKESCLDVNFSFTWYLLCTISNHQLNTLSIPVAIKNKENKTIKIPALIDSGAGGIFIDQNYAKRSYLQIQKLNKPLVTRNVDNTKNKHGKITSFVELNLTVNGKTWRTKLM